MPPLVDTRLTRKLYTEWNVGRPVAQLLGSGLGLGWRGTRGVGDHTCGPANREAMAEVDVDKICQVFSGCVFALFVGIFVFADSSTPVQLKRLPIDVRWQAATRICMFVCIFSCCFNLFQVTELDNVDLRRESPYTLDVARPVEWMFTCPLMQLVLVVLCGDRVPDHRLILMPVITYDIR